MNNMSKREAREIISILLTTGKLKDLLESIQIKLSLIGHSHQNAGNIAFFRYSPIYIAFSNSFVEGTNTPVPLSIVRHGKLSNDFAVLFCVNEIRDDLCSRRITITDFINAIKKMVGVDAFQKAIEDVWVKTTLYWH